MQRADYGSAPAAEGSAGPSPAASGEATQGVVRWTVDPLFNLPGPRTGASGFAANGALYLVGGSDGTAPRKELYWALPDATGALPAGWHHLAAATVSFLVAVTSNYTWNRLWTFRGQRGHVAYQGIRFLIVAVCALAANLILLDLLVSFGVEKVPAQAIAIILVTPLNFIGNKLWSFRRKA